MPADKKPVTTPVPQPAPQQPSDKTISMSSGQVTNSGRKDKKNVRHG